MKPFFISIGLLICSICSFTQELNCNVVVNSTQVQTTNRQIFDNLQKSITEFMNNRRWTDMSVLPNERINCNLTIVINRMENNERFDAELTIQSVRPVFKSSYTTPLLNMRDQNFSFTYVEFAPLEFNEMSFESNLTAVLAFYAYVIIGYDSDSFSRLGGTPFFRRAESICSMAQGAAESGWKAFESSRNRYALISGLTNDAYRRFREFFYEYHRWGLDEMSGNVEKGRDRIASNLVTLREMNRQYPSNYVITSFLEAKNDELINIFSRAGEKQRTDVYNILMDVNPTQSSRYEAILKGR